MSGRGPNQQEWGAAKEAFSSARADVVNRWNELTIDQQKAIKEKGLEFSSRLGAINAGVRQVTNPSAEAVTALGVAEGAYEELLEELEDHIKSL